MPKQTKPQPKQQAFNFKGFVRCELSKNEADDYKVWSDGTTDLDLWQLVMTIADSGYSFKVGESSRGQSASLTNVDGPSESKGWILSAYGGTADRASRALFYKHYVKLAESWPTEAAADGWDLG